MKTYFPYIRYYIEPSGLGEAPWQLRRVIGRPHPILGAILGDDTLAGYFSSYHRARNAIQHQRLKDIKRVKRRGALVVYLPPQVEKIREKVFRDWQEGKHEEHPEVAPVRVREQIAYELSVRVGSGDDDLEPSPELII